MARNDSTRKAKQDHIGEPDPDLLTHIQTLGLSTVADYLGWCAQHGFTVSTRQRRPSPHPACPKPTTGLLSQGHRSP
jgi:hypothetical protein